MNTKDDKMARYRELANRPLTEHSNPGIAAFYQRLHEEDSPLLHSTFDDRVTFFGAPARNPVPAQFAIGR